MNSIKKFTAALAALAVSMTSVFTFSVAVAATTFTDASSISDWAADSVAALADSGVLSGRPDGSFDPQGQLNRAEVAKVAVEAAGLTEDTTGAPHFNDVASSDWYYNYVETLYNNGVVGGINGGALDANGMATYNPAGTLNRAEGSKILVDAFDLETSYSGTPPNFPDVASSAWYFDYVETAYAHGIINGYSDGNFGPGDAITREQVAVIAKAGVDEVADASKRRTDYTAGAASAVEVTTPDTPTTPTIPASDGTLTVAISASSPAAADVPGTANAFVAAWDLTATGEDVVVTGLVIKHGGIGARAQVTAQVLKDADGNRISKSKGTPNSDDETTFTLLSGGLTVAAGTTETIKLIVTTGTSGKHDFSLVAAEVITSNAKSIAGTFPITSETMSFSTTTAGVLTIANDGTPANVKVGEQDATIAKLKLQNGNVEDIELTAITLKETGTASEGSAINNIKLMQGTTEVATGTLNDKYISFQLDTPYLIAKNKTEKFTVTANIIGEAAKTLIIDLDNTIDIESTGLTYGFGASVADSFTAASLTIDAGDISIVKLDPDDKIRRNKTDVVLATVEIAVNSGSNVEMKAFNATVASTGGYNVNDMLENVELYDVATGTVYDLTGLSAATSNTLYDRDLDIAFSQGEVRTFELRADTRSVKADGTTTTDFTGLTLTVSISGIGDSTNTDGIDFQETTDDTAVTDVTPSSLVFNTIDGSASSATLTVIKQSTTENAVIGSTGVEGLIFEIEAGTSSDVTLDEVSVKGIVNDVASVTTTVTVAETTAAVQGTITIDTDVVLTADAYGTGGNSLAIIVTAEDSATGADDEGVTITKSGSVITAAIHNETTGGAVVDVTRAGLVACLNTGTTATLSDASYTTGANTDGTIVCTVTNDVTGDITASGTSTTKAIAVTSTSLAGGLDEISTITLSAELAAGDTTTITVDSLAADPETYATSHAATMTAWAVQIAANATIASAVAAGNVITVTGAAANGLFTLTSGAVTSTANDGTDTVANNTRVNKMTLYYGTTALDATSGSSLTSAGVATFNGFEHTITKNTSDRFSVEVDYVSDTNQTNDTLNLEITAVSLEDDDSDDLTNVTISGSSVTAATIGTGVARSDRTVTIVGVGTIATTVKTNEVPLNTTQNVLGNTTSDVVAAFQLSATNESVIINDLRINETSGSTLDGNVAEIILLEADKTTEIARKPVAGAEAVTFTAVDYEVAEGSENLYVKVVAAKIGQGEAGAAASALTFTIDITKAKGGESSATVALPAVSGASNAFNVYPVNIGIPAVAESMEGKVLSDGAATTVAKITLAADDTANTLAASNTVLTTEAEVVRVRISTLTNLTVTEQDITLQRVNPLDGTNNVVVAVKVGSSGGTDESIALNDYVEFTLTGAGFGNNEELKQTATYEIILAAPVATAANKAYFEVSMLPNTGVNAPVEFGSDESGAEGYLVNLTDTIKLGQLVYAGL